VAEALRHDPEAAAAERPGNPLRRAVVPHTAGAPVRRGGDDAGGLGRRDAAVEQHIGG
jgi:hypothetical protein